MFYVTRRTIEYRKSRKCNTLEDKLNFVLFESDTVLLMIGVLFLYHFFKYSKLLFILDSIGNILSIFYYKLIDDKKYHLYTTFALIQVIVFTSFATLILGWRTGFYYYIFLSFVAFFLPFYLKDEEVEKQISRIPIGVLLIILFFALYYLTNNVNLSFSVSVPRGVEDAFCYINFTVNAILIIAFAYFYSSLIILEKKELSSRADYDELTELYNRYVLNKNLEANIKLVDGKAKDTENFLVAMLDIDFFKKINDTYGHNAGDYVLKILAKKFKKFVKYGMLVGRWGGEEFLFMSTSMEKDVFEEKLNDLRKEVEKTNFKYNGKKIKVTVSIGIGKYISGMDPTVLVKAADDNLYKAKEGGRNRVVS